MEHEKLQRSQEGVKAGSLGLICNILLAIVKFFVGMSCNSITIIGDGVNNLTDSISSAVTILGFQMAGVEQDEMHPYGHGRVEYITGFLISLMILGTGISVGKAAAVNILHPEAVLVSAPTAGVLVISIAVKLGMMFYYGSKNREMKSPALEAVQRDCLGDVCVSTLALAGFLAMPWCRMPVDGILGIIMAAYIFASGMKSFRENFALLLGEGPSRKIENELREILTGCKEIECVEEITVHDYGPDKKIAVAEVSFAENCDRETKQRVADYVIRICKDAMNIELSLYSPIY